MMDEEKLDTHTVEGLLALCLRIGEMCHVAATMDTTAMRVSLLMFGDQLKKPETPLVTTKRDLQAQSLVSQSSVKSALRDLEPKLLARERGDHARGGRDRFRLRLAEQETEAHPARAGPETKETPGLPGPASVGRLEDVPEFPVEPRDQPTNASNPKEPNLYRL